MNSNTLDLAAPAMNAVNVKTSVATRNGGGFLPHTGEYLASMPRIDCNVELLIKGTLHRLGICVMPRWAAGRREMNGPLLAGPWADTFGLATCIHDGSVEMKNRERAERDARTITVETGTLLRIDDAIYRVEVYRREYIRLHPVD